MLFQREYINLHICINMLYEVSVNYLFIFRKEMTVPTLPM